MQLMEISLFERHESLNTSRVTKGFCCHHFCIPYHQQSCLHFKHSLAYLPDFCADFMKYETKFNGKFLSQMVFAIDI